MSLPYIRIPTARAIDADKWLDEPEVEAKDFFTALGKFVVTWSDVEGAIYDVLMHYSKVSEPVARALFSGSRARAMMSQLNAIADNTGMSMARKEDLAELAARVSALNTVRDRVAHSASSKGHTSHPPYLKQRISNERRSSRYKKGFVQFVGSTELNEYVHECLVICSALRRHLESGQFRRMLSSNRKASKVSKKR